MKADIPHERTRFLAAATQTTDLAAVEFYQSLDDEGRSEIGGLLAEARTRVGKLREKNAARLSAEQEKEKKES